MTHIAYKALYMAHIAFIVYIASKLYYSKFYPNSFCNIEKEGCYVIGITGGSASGKTSVAKKIIEGIDIPWVVLLSMDSFYKGISTEGKIKSHFLYFEKKIEFMKNKNTKNFQRIK